MLKIYANPAGLERAEARNLGALLDEEKRELSRALVDRVVVRDGKVERVELRCKDKDCLAPTYCWGRSSVFVDSALMYPSLPPALLDWATVLAYVSFTLFIAWRVLAPKKSDR